MRHCLALGVLLFLIPFAPAAEQDVPDWTIRLTVSPAEAPVPALRYPLLPELRDLSPGNAVLLYYRAFSPQWLTHRQPEEAEKLKKWYEDRSKNPAEELRWVLTYRPLKEVDLAARRVYCDWELNERMRKEGIGMVLPDVQFMREFANLLALRARFEITAGEHEKVIHTLQTGMALSRHVAEGPTLIQTFVGIAIGRISLGEVEHWIEKPGAPNLYWSLTNLPSPFIEMRKPMQGERFFMESMFRGLREAMKEKKPELFSIERIPFLVRELDQLAGMNRSEGSLQNVGGRLELALYAAKVHPAAKKALLAQAWNPKEVEAMPVTKAAIMLEVLNYDRYYDDLAKWFGLPYWQAHEGLLRTDRQFKEDLAEGGAVGMMLARLLLPAVQKVLAASANLDRKIAALRCIEALRLHAAAHDGQLPAKLADITEVPIPRDPVTGQAFEYRVEDGKAVLTGPAPAGERPHGSNSIRYEITLKK
jgi:hypothetical protein